MLWYLHASLPGYKRWLTLLEPRLLRLRLACLPCLYITFGLFNRQGLGLSCRAMAAAVGGSVVFGETGLPRTLRRVFPAICLYEADNGLS